MNNPDNLLNFVEWDVRNWSAALDFWLANSAHGLKDASVLEIGSNFGGLSLWLASKGAKVVCSDVNGATEKAVLRHRAGGVSDSIEYEAIDATNIPYAEKFDIIVFKSVLGDIGDKGQQAKALREMHKALKKGGELFFAENLVASPAHMFFRRKMIKWGTMWRYVTVDEMKEFLRPFSHVDFRIFGFAGAFGRSETQRNLLGLADKVLFDRIVPNKWKYIIAGVARK
ncbi:MAG TPA: class I SAM-dependent methyltransferase [Pyrinomonadaceae bacterium]|jgi:SAM-dependent methyltransferase